MGTPRPIKKPELISTEDGVGTLCIDGQPLTASDIERLRSDRVARTEQTHRAVLAVASYANDSADCLELLSMLGFDNRQLVEARHQFRLEHSTQTAKAS